MNAADAEPEDINGQVRSILAKVESTLDIWQALTQRFDVDMFCGLFMHETNSGFSLAPDVMMLLGERGITIDFDIYAADEDDDVPSSP